MKYLLNILAIASVFTTFGQEDVEIVATGERHVEKAYRIEVNPRIIDTNLAMATVDYPLLSLKMETQTEVDRINPASVNMKEKLAQLYNSYLKVGVGTELMPLGEFSFNSKRSRKFLYGAHVRHLSSWGNIADYAPSTFDRTKVGLYGAINEKRYTLKGDMHYNNQGLHYYARPVDSIELVADSIAQRYSDFGLGGSFASHKKDSAKLNYNVGMAYNSYRSKKPLDENFADDWRAKENYFEITSGAWYKLKSEVYGADFNIRYNGYKYGIVDSSMTGLDSGIVLNNTVINFKPHITTRLKDNRFKAKIGMDLVFDVHDRTRVHIYPIAELKYSMFNDIFIPYVGLRGGLKQNTFRSITQQDNEFILPNVYLKNEHNPLDFYGGIKGTLSKRVYFNASASFANVKNKALFVNDSLHSLGNAFDIIYDTLNITTIEGSISYQMNEKLKVDGIAKYYSYSALNEAYAWNLPQLQIILRGSYNLYNKFIFNLDLNMEEGRRARVYETGEGVTEENGQLVKKLDFIADANLNVEYRYNKRISAFLQLNNFAAQRYKRWYNAPVHGFQVMGGVTFRF